MVLAKCTSVTVKTGQVKDKPSPDSKYCVRTGHPSWTILIACLHGACHSSDSFPLLFISQTNVIVPTDLLEYIPVCHWLSSDARPMYQSGEKVYSVPSRNVFRKQDVQVRPIWYYWTENRLYPCGKIYSTSQNRLDKKVHQAPSHNVVREWHIWFGSIWYCLNCKTVQAKGLHVMTTVFRVTSLSRTYNIDTPFPLGSFSCYIMRFH